MSAHNPHDSGGQPVVRGQSVAIHGLNFVRPSLAFADIEIDGVTYARWRVERRGAVFHITPPRNAQHIYAGAYLPVLYAFRAAWLLRFRSHRRPIRLSGERRMRIRRGSSS